MRQLRATMIAHFSGGEMSDQDKSSVNFKKRFEKAYPHLKEFTAFLMEMNQETDRGAALVAATLIEELLKRCLLAFMVDNKGAKGLFDGMNAPLHGFSSRIAAAYGLGLISNEEYEDCQIIRKVRNEFAHTLGTNYENKKIIGLCANLHGSAKPYGDGQVNTRGQFSTAAVALILNLTNRPHYIGRKRLTYEEWQR